MGLLVDGVWQEGGYDTDSTGGRFERPNSAFRDFVTADGSSGFRAEKGRYRLYVSCACPWAHRTLIFRALKGLEDAIPVSVVDPLMGGEGWVFSGAGDPETGAGRLSDLYAKTKPDYTGRVTVPVLWDTEKSVIVNNESSEIIRMLNSEFDAWGVADADFYPEGCRDEIDAVNAFVYENVNNGVYKAGFATTQEAYDEAVGNLFAALDLLDGMLSRQRYLVGHRITEADWRLFTTLIRFDTVYYSHFKCNVRRIVDYPALWDWLRELYHFPGISGTVNMDHIKRHYYGSHPNLNPSGIVPKGPEIDFTPPHGRRLAA